MPNTETNHQLSSYHLRKQRGIEDKKWRTKQKTHYEHIEILFKGFAVSLTFLILMSMVSGIDSLWTFFMLYLLIITLFIAQTSKLRSKEYFWSDIKTYIRRDEPLSI